MKVVIQRVSHAWVTVNEQKIAEIGKGMLILAGFENEDSTQDLEYIKSKILNLRIFDDSNGVMNLSLCDIDGEILVVSQFTLHAQTKKGNRPSYIKAARPEIATLLYSNFLQMIRESLGKEPQSGQFGAEMSVSLVNEGPVTIIIDSKEK